MSRAGSPGWWKNPRRDGARHYGPIGPTYFTPVIFHAQGRARATIPPGIFPDQPAQYPGRPGAVRALGLQGSGWTSAYGRLSGTILEYASPGPDLRPGLIRTLKQIRKLQG
jgi:hypothetical protein